jgi:hypothetical protein
MTGFQHVLYGRTFRNLIEVPCDDEGGSEEKSQRERRAKGETGREFEREWLYEWQKVLYTPQDGEVDWVPAGAEEMTRSANAHSIAIHRHIF